MDIKAAKTIFIAVLTFPVCVVASWTRVKSGSNDSAWLRHILYISMLMSSGINPVIYCFRVRRFRRALKQLLNDPCGKTPFQDSDQKLRFKHNVPNQNARKMGLSARRFGKREKAGHKDEECGLDIPNQVMSPEDHQFENTPRATWVETHPKNFAVTRSGVESLKPTADYTRHAVTVEVHPVPYNKPLKQKVAKKPTSSDVYTGKEHFVRIHLNPKDQPSKTKNPGE